MDRKRKIKIALAGLMLLPDRYKQRPPEAKPVVEEIPEESRRVVRITKRGNRFTYANYIEAARESGMQAPSVLRCLEYGREYRSGDRFEWADQQGDSDAAISSSPPVISDSYPDDD